MSHHYTHHEEKTTTLLAHEKCIVEYARIHPTSASLSLQTHLRGPMGAEPQSVSLAPPQDEEGLHSVFPVVNKLTTASDSLMNSMWLGVRTAFW